MHNYIKNVVRAYLSYERLDFPISYWRTSSGFEVDLIVGDMDPAIECKSTREFRTADLKGLRALNEENVVRRKLVVSRVENPRTTEACIEILPWRSFCRELWNGQLI